MFLVALALLVPQQPVVPASAALVLMPQGTIVDQLSGDPFERALARAQGFQTSETLLKDLVDAVRAAQDDDRIKALVLRLDGLTGAGLSKLEELAGELSAFKLSGKPIYAIGAAYDRNQYYLAAHADEVFMHPMGLVLIDGYSAYVPYYKSLLDKLYIDYSVWTVGEYKSFVEPITRDDMSAEDRESRSQYLGAMWRHYQQDVTTARSLEENSLQRYADEYVNLLREASGDTARLAAEYDLVDEILAFDQMADRIREVAGPAGDSDSGYAAVDYESYLAALRATDFAPSQPNKVSVIVTAGEILDGTQPSGTVGAESTVRLIRAAREDSNTRALVLRVDSPGGSAYASEVILRELELFRATERPLVVSMGSVAASGGYWISMSADEIWASPTTLTGSIGVGATFPTFPRALAELGIHIDGVGTTDLSGQMDASIGIGEDIDAYVGMSIQHTYDQFIGKVAEHRELESSAVEESAQGRVWIGSDALERGLVDRLGGLDLAIASAAALAGLAEGEYSIEHIEAELGFAERVALELVRVLSPAVSALGWRPELPESIESLLAAFNDPLLFSQRLNDPRGIYAYCFCDVR